MGNFGGFVYTIWGSLGLFGSFWNLLAMTVDFGKFCEFSNNSVVFCSKYDLDVRCVFWD